MKHVRATSGNRPLVEPLLQRLADVVRLGVDRMSPLGTERHGTVTCLRAEDN